MTTADKKAKKAPSKEAATDDGETLKSAPSDASDLTDQAAIDRYLAQVAAGKDDSGQSDTPKDAGAEGETAEPPASDDTPDDLTDQASIDRYLAQAADGENDSEKNDTPKDNEAQSETAEPPASDDTPDDLTDQASIDRYLAQAADGENDSEKNDTPKDAGAQSETAEPPASDGTPDDLTDQASIDRYLAQATDGENDSDDDIDEAPDEQEKADKLIAELMEQNKIEDDPDDQTPENNDASQNTPEDENNGDEAPDEQEKADKLIAELMEQNKIEDVADTDDRTLQTEETATSSDAAQKEDPVFFTEESAASSEAEIATVTEKSTTGTGGLPEPEESLGLSSLEKVAPLSESDGGEDNDDFASLDDDEDLDDYDYVISEDNEKPLPTVEASPESESAETEAETVIEILPEINVPKSSSRWKSKLPRLSKRWTIAVGATVAVGMLAGFLLWWFYNRSNEILPQAQKAPVSKPAVSQTNPEKPSLRPVAKQEKSTVPESLTGSPLAAKVEKAQVMRASLVEKTAEIDSLQSHYINGIQQTMGAIIDDSQQRGIETAKKAIADESMHLQMNSIQQRRRLLKELEAPAAQIRRGSEELLYLQRLAEIENRMASVFVGVDIPATGQKIDTAVASNQRALEQLQAPPKQSLESLETIWDLVMKEKQKRQAAARQAQLVPKPTPPEINQQISEQICSGNLNRAYDLSSLDATTAACLAEADNRILFLNNIQTLTPQVAQELVRWQGRWLGLNGLTHLTPEAARILFQWPGERLSLNGLAVLTALETTYLQKWRGREIELMGLDGFSYQVAVDLTRWKRAGGTVYVKEKFRKPKSEDEKKQ